MGLLLGFWMCCVEGVEALGLATVRATFWVDMEES
jgi:hypothetical protein